MSMTSKISGRLLNNQKAQLSKPKLTQPPTMIFFPQSGYSLGVSVPGRANFLDNYVHITSDRSSRLGYFIDFQDTVKYNRVIDFGYDSSDVFIKERDKRGVHEFNSLIYSFNNGSPQNDLVIYNPENNQIINRHIFDENNGPTTFTTYDNGDRLIIEVPNSSGKEVLIFDASGLVERYSSPEPPWLIHYSGNFNFIKLSNGSILFKKLVGSINSREAELWLLEATSSRPVKIDLDLDTSDSLTGISPFAEEEIGGKVYFAAGTTISGPEPWVYELGSRQARLFKDINTYEHFPTIMPGVSDGSFPEWFTPLEDRNRFIFKPGYSARTGLDLGPWISDGTPSGTKSVQSLPKIGGDFSTLHAGSGGSERFNDFREIGFKESTVGNKLFFVAGESDDPSYHSSLWIADANSYTSELIQDLKLEDTDSLNFIASEVVGEKIYFLMDYRDASDERNRRKGRVLWVSDGTKEGTYIVKSTLGEDAKIPDQTLTEYDNKLFFTIENVSTNNGNIGNDEYWVTDGTIEGTQKIAELSVHTPRPTLEKFGNHLFISFGTRWSLISRADDSQETEPPEGSGYNLNPNIQNLETGSIYDSKSILNITRSEVYDENGYQDIKRIDFKLLQQFPETGSIASIINNEALPSVRNFSPVDNDPNIATFDYSIDLGQYIRSGSNDLNLESGRYRLKAVAEDKSGLRSEAFLTDFTIQNDPEITFEIAPTYHVNQDLTLEMARVIDKDGYDNISRIDVEIRNAEGEIVHTETINPDAITKVGDNILDDREGEFDLSIDLDNFKHGQHTISVTAYDEQNGVGSSEQSFSVNNLGIDRWWATAGTDEYIPVTWRFFVNETDKYELKLDLKPDFKPQKWGFFLDKNDPRSKATVRGLDFDYFLDEPFLERRWISSGPNASPTEYVFADLGTLEPGTYEITFNAKVPDNPVIEELVLELDGPGSGNDQILNAYFVADRPTLALETDEVQEINDLIRNYAPVLSFDVGTEPDSGGQERHALPLDVTNYALPEDANHPAYRSHWEQRIEHDDPEKDGFVPQGSRNAVINLLDYKNGIRRSAGKEGKIYAVPLIKDLANPNELAVSYYFHYGRSNWDDHGGRNTHQGDWEGITVYFELQEIDGNPEWIPQTAGFAQHIKFPAGISDGGDTYRWNFLSKHDSSMRPTVYVSLGGHASFGYSGQKEYVDATEWHTGGGVLKVPEVEVLPRVGDYVPGINTTFPDWLLFPGRWGQIGEGQSYLGGGDDGPEGPVFQDQGFGRGTRWFDPWEWSSGFDVPLIAVDDQLSTSSSQPIKLDILRNDNYEEFNIQRNDRIQKRDPYIWIKKNPEHGSISIQTVEGELSAVYTPNPNYLGEDTFSYQIIDPSDSAVFRNFEVLQRSSTTFDNPLFGPLNEYFKLFVETYTFDEFKSLDPDSLLDDSEKSEEAIVKITVTEADASATSSGIKLDGNQSFSMLAPNLKIDIAKVILDSVAEVGIFPIDSITSAVDGIEPDHPTYTQTALSKSIPLFSTITNLPDGYNPSAVINRTLALDSGNQFKFYIIPESTGGANLSSVNNLTIASPDTLQISDAGDGSYVLNWKLDPASAGFNDLSFTISAHDDSAPLGTTALQGNSDGEVLDLRRDDLTGQPISTTFEVYREAAYNNTVGFYTVVDELGGIDTTGDGIANFRPGDSGYTQAALAQSIDARLSTDNQSVTTFDTQLLGGSILAPYLIVDSSSDALLDSDPNNDPYIYFAYSGANTDGVDHIRLLGDNTFGFEDLHGGGDRDYNDVIIKANLA